jgi:hypothetical protein
MDIGARKTIQDEKLKTCLNIQKVGGVLIHSSTVSLP